MGVRQGSSLPSTYRDPSVCTGHRFGKHITHAPSGFSSYYFSNVVLYRAADNICHPRVKGFGRICSRRLNPSHPPVRKLAAASFISSVIAGRLAFKAPLKIPEYHYIVYLFGEVSPASSTTRPSLAQVSMISGTGFAMAKEGWRPIFMDATMSGLLIPGADTPTKMSAPFMASARYRS